MLNITLILNFTTYIDSFWKVIRASRQSGRLPAEGRKSFVAGLAEGDEEFGRASNEACVVAARQPAKNAAPAL